MLYILANGWMISQMDMASFFKFTHRFTMKAKLLEVWLMVGEEEYHQMEVILKVFNIKFLSFLGNFSYGTC
jgi:hypothetical protein